MNLNNARSNVNTNIGARPAFETQHASISNSRVARQSIIQKDVKSTVYTEILNRRDIPVACSDSLLPPPN